MNKLFIGIKGHAVCIDKISGHELWSTKLKTATGVTNILAEGDCVFVYAGGHLYCLDSYSGAIKWENKLKGMGYGPCIMANADQSSSVVAADLAAQQSAAAYTATHQTASSDASGD